MCQSSASINDCSENLSFSQAFIQYFRKGVIMGYYIQRTAQNRWLKRTVPFIIDSAVPQPIKTMIADAILEWNSNTIMKFIPVAPGAPNSIRFVNSKTKASSSPRGMQGGEQQIQCAANVSVGALIHEIGHAMGLMHEQIRPDRNSFVNVEMANVDLTVLKASDFDIDSSGVKSGQYDCASIMHYDELTGSVDGIKQPITITDPVLCPAIGLALSPNPTLSAGDITAIKEMYESIDELKAKVTLTESSDFGPSIAFHNNQIFLAWRGSGNEHLNIAVSNDGGFTFAGKLISDEDSDDAPFIASHNGILFVTWRGSGNEQINVGKIEISNDGTTVVRIKDKIILGDTTDCSPTLTSHGGTLYLAFRGLDEAINILISTDNGATFKSKHVSNETTTDSPALTSRNGALFVAWKGSGNEQLNLARALIAPDAANPAVTQLIEKVVSPERSDYRPAVATLNNLVFMGWTGVNNEFLNLMVNGASNKVSPETSSHAPSLAATNNELLIAWKGSNNFQLNVAHMGLGSQSASDIALGNEAMSNDILLQLKALRESLDNGFVNLSQGLGAVLTLQQFTNTALTVQLSQSSTMICQLEQIAIQTCGILSESHFQTAFQKEIAENLLRLVEIAKSAHPEAELDIARLEKLRLQIEKCCPPAPEPQLCQHEPCSVPTFDIVAPTVEYKPLERPVPDRRQIIG